MTTEAPKSALPPIPRDLAVIAAAVLSFAVLGTLGGEVLAYASSLDYYFPEDLPAIYWLRWGNVVVGRFSGDLFCGFLLGRYLRRISPWLIMAALLCWPVAVMAINRGFWNADEGQWVAAIGPTAAIAQQALRVVAMAAIVSLGIWLDRRVPQDKKPRASNRD